MRLAIPSVVLSFVLAPAAQLRTAGSSRSASMRRLVGLVLVGVLSVGASARSAAMPITYTLIGEVETFSDDNNLLGGSVALGTPLTFSFTLDPTLLVDEDAGSSSSSWTIATPFSIAAGGVNVGGMIDGIRVTNDFIGLIDALSFGFSGLHSNVPSNTLRTVSLSFSGFSSVLTSDAWPFPLDPTSFVGLFDPWALEVVLAKDFSTVAGFRTNFSSMTAVPAVTSVPEPATIALLAAGLAGLAARRTANKG